MKFRWMLILALTAFLAGCANVCSTDCRATERAIPCKESGTHYAADAIKPYVERGECPGAISIFYNQGVQETACIGWADVDKKIPMSLDRMFMQCSQTKGFCGVTIAILVEEGKISLDDPVANYLPAFKDLKVKVKDEQGNTTLVPAQNTLTIRMVMNHTGGYPFEIPTKSKRGWSSLSIQDTAREAATLPLLFEPGTAVRYSNTGIDIGAAIVEVVTGQSWDSFLKERVLDPLGMTDTTFNPTDEQLSRTISMYNVKGGQQAQYRSFNPAMPRPYNGPTVFPSAGAGLWTTAADQVKFYKMLMNLGIGENGVRILKADTVKSILATSTRPDHLGEYSLGLTTNKSGWMGHGGAWHTSCSVNWQTKRLRLWVVQHCGSNLPWTRDWVKASEAFFAQKVEDSGVSEYTGRMK